MKLDRRGGVLLHPTSLPSAYGIGDFGTEAYRFIDWMEHAGCRIWQILPLNPPGLGDSPYATLSAFAGNQLLISPDELVRDGLLTLQEATHYYLPSGRIDFQRVNSNKRRLLEIAYLRFLESASSLLQDEFKRYREREAWWLNDWCTFHARKHANGGKHWRDWDETIATEQSNLDRCAWEQFFFDRQWKKLREYAKDRDIVIIGDIPLFVADDSADCCFHRELFEYDDRSYPTLVAGVPPDYFSETGQWWGNPQYRWQKHQADSFAWWKSRIRRMLSHCDVVRIDHFRGLAASWMIPATATDARSGEWVTVPGGEMLKAVAVEFGDLPLIAEDLGTITADVLELRDNFNLPGMKVLQFAFDSDGHHPFLPHNYPTNCIVYTGTHDNNTSSGWYEHDATEYERDRLRRYLSVSGSDVAWDLIRAAWGSVAAFAIVPVQDILMAGQENRMNLPGSSAGNWNWRLLPGQLRDEHAEGLLDLTLRFGRDRVAT